MVAKHIVAEPYDAPDLTNSQKVDLYLDYLDGVDGTEPSEGTVYRTAAVVSAEPCGACVHDIRRPNERTGYPDPTSPMMMCCNVCGDRWIDPTLERQARDAQRTLDEMSKQAEMMTRMADRLIEDTFRTRRTTHIVAAALVTVVVFGQQLVRILFP